MDSFDPDRETPENDLVAAVRSLPLPETPASIAGAVLRRLRQRRRRGLAAAVALVAAVMLAVLLWRPWHDVGTPTPPPPPIAANEIPAQELEVLFAPPPVDSLAILNRRDRSTVLVLSRLEERK